MLERTLVYVDTSYLLASFYNSWATGARAQLEIDLPEVVSVLSSMIEAQLGQPIQRQFWYDGIPENGPHRYQRALRTCDGVQLRAGQLIEWGERRTQKAVDTRLVADMVIAGVKRQCSDMVLVSGDADMIPGVQEATAAGIRVHLYGFGWDSMSSALRHACDSTTILDPREDFADCMQLAVLEGPLPPTIAKPIGDAEPLDDLGPTTVPMVGDTAANSQQVVEEDAATTDSTAGTVQTVESTTARESTLEIATPTEHISVHTASVEREFTAMTPAAADAGCITDDSASEVIEAPATTATPADLAHSVEATPSEQPNEVESATPSAAESTDSAAAATAQEESDAAEQEKEQPKRSVPSPAAMPAERPKPNPSMMAPRRKLRSRYVPLPNEVWASAGFQTPYDVGQQYASWWYNNAASPEQRDQAHLLSGGGLPPEIDRPLLQFACETLHEYTLTEEQRVKLRDGFHSGIRAVLLNRP